MKASPSSRFHDLVKLSRTGLYDLYWQFAAERQEIFFRRLEGASTPWTDDPILRDYKFTNAYRASDRVSQFLIRHVIYNEHYPDTPVEVVFRTLLFKLFNKISTWRMLENSLGMLTWQSFNPDDYDRVLSYAITSGVRIYSAAYIVPPVTIDRSGVKHRGHLKLLDFIVRSDFVSRLQESNDLREVFLILKQYPSLGDFLAFQFAIDLNYSPVINHDENGFVVAGPGAQDGLSKIFPDSDRREAKDLIALMMERQEVEFARLGIEFRSLWGRPLQLIDCQNLLCELSKYTRVSHPGISGLSGRSRIKQLFRPQDCPTQPWYPPKWGLNNKIPTYASTIPSDLFGLER